MLSLQCKQLGVENTVMNLIDAECCVIKCLKI